MNNREIKFRAWQPDKKQLWSQDLRTNWEMLRDAEWGGAILMQYSGLKDKNGVEIYDGDIVRQLGEVLRVFYNTSTACFDLEYPDGDCEPLCMASGWEAEDTEVIGNIYQQPELIS